MSRFLPYIGTFALFALAVGIVAISSNKAAQRMPTTAPFSASTTLAVIPSFTLPPITLPAPQSATATSAAIPTAPPAAPFPAPIVRIPSPAAPAPAVPPPASESVVESSPLAISAIALRNALVNIICRLRVDAGVRSISGSGVIIDPRGIILTNAHVAQLFLLTDRGASCTIRTGSPAIDAYKAALIYISPPWLRENAERLSEESPKGTGEYDFAFLAVTRSATSSVALPAPFPYVPLATEPALAGTPVVIASYGAQFLEFSQIKSSLFPTVVFSSVKEVLTFNLNTIDVLALGGSAAAQEGSSGGGVADKSGKLIGTLTTSTIEGDTSTRALNAITASYIRSEYANETTQSLDTLFGKSTQKAVADFALRIPSLAAIISTQLP